MPLNILRLNWRHQPPNDRIIFIKALPGPDSTLSESYLSRIAAICAPIMRTHHLSVTSLEEFPPNREFAGRNFNAGECIQLVLKTFSGQWLPFRHVQMVMMHELAHNLQMNHGKQFWKERELFAKDLRVLWEKGFKGEGVWGTGQRVGGLGEEFDGQAIAEGWEEGEVPAELCGGTFRSRRKKRTAKPELSYQEKKQKRIEKKFGKNGVELGGDCEERVKLENGKQPKGKPRVAQSARGRELRAAAALARFGQQQKKDDDVKEEAVEETESDYEEEDIKAEALDIDGKKLRDGKGDGMIRVCEGQDSEDVHVKKEMEELQEIDEETSRRKVEVEPVDKPPQPIDAKSEDSETNHANPQRLPSVSDRSQTPDQISNPIWKIPQHPPEGDRNASPPIKHRTVNITCPICTTINPHRAFTCITCAHVLDLNWKPGSGNWRCGSKTCRDTGYVNASACGLCGICGERKPEV